MLLRCFPPLLWGSIGRMNTGVCFPHNKAAFFCSLPASLPPHAAIFVSVCCCCSPLAPPAAVCARVCAHATHAGEKKKRGAIHRCGRCAGGAWELSNHGQHQTRGFKTDAFNAGSTISISGGRSVVAARAVVSASSVTRFAPVDFPGCECAKAINPERRKLGAMLGIFGRELAVGRSGRGGGFDD